MRQHQNQLPVAILSLAVTAGAIPDPEQQKLW